ncbi:rhoptry neck protein 12 [Plasmodium gaboni]|uniref:Rhoptry neck protein 12 n=1 Tax=Plasmodium gaboni TaxID=647221 RepID=A0ABY1UNS9_9APIC|nr:rhoptry neck protein 12 [Plasmodium gaboni]
MKRVHIYLCFTFFFFLCILKGVYNVKTQKNEGIIFNKEGNENDNENNDRNTSNNSNRINRITLNKEMYEKYNKMNNEEDNNKNLNYDLSNSKNGTKKKHFGSKSSEDKTNEKNSINSVLEKYEHMKHEEKNLQNLNKNMINQENDDSMKSIFISEESFENAKNVCQFIVMQNDYFKKFCNITSLVYDIEKLKKNNNKIYEGILSNSYENNNGSKLKLLKEINKPKVFKEMDNTNPKFSILFLYDKFCYGGIPLACSNLMKYDNVFDVNQQNETSDKSGDSLNVDEMENYFINQTGMDNEFEENISDLTQE